MKFSICIPNYNYGRYIGQTVRSALDQKADVEVLVADNASTDNSVAVVQGIEDARVRLIGNRWNVGFAGNLDRACSGATGNRMLLLSSDDLAGPDAFSTYASLARELGEVADRAVFCSGQHEIDGEGRITGESALDFRQWADASDAPELGERIGARVLRVRAHELLARAMAHLRNPFNFATTCYPRALYEAVEGYGGGALINPDKAFAWKLLSVAEEVFYIDRPLFSYRVHASNQNSQQRQSGALKHLIDQYRATFDTAAEVLSAAQLTNDDLARAFVEHDIALRGLKALAEGDRLLARRHLKFGQSTYPALMSRSRRVWMLRTALALGPLGTVIARSKLDAAINEYRSGKNRMSSRSLNILIAGGGTGGHLFPGIAIAESFMDKDPGNRILFVNACRPIDQSAISNAGFDLRCISAEGIKGRGLWRKLLSALNPADSIEFLLDKMNGTKDNNAFLASMNS